jgi:adenosylcobinamide kinase/adenosylcobinamide-phosphate guanylyltransferase
MNPEVAPASQVILVTGPARSGKSEWAETLAMQAGLPVLYVATARIDPADVEWQARIEGHRQRRCQSWTTLEVPAELPDAIAAAPMASCLLVDSLGTWVANLLESDGAGWERTQQKLLASLQGTRAGQVIFVAEETGWGVVPAYPAGRLFRDRQGMLVRRLGAIANPVYLVTGGHALNLSALGSPLPPES